MVVGLTGGTLVYGTLDMPHFGVADAPIHRYPQPGYVEKTRHDMPNPQRRDVAGSAVATRWGNDGQFFRPRRGGDVPEIQPRLKETHKA